MEQYDKGACNEALQCHKNHMYLAGMVAELVQGLLVVLQSQAMLVLAPQGQRRVLSQGP